MKSRVDEAVKLFEAGYNCCQSVFAAYADLFGMDRETALKLSSPMGAGMGRMREVCGAVSAMALLAGLKDGNTDPTDQQAKAKDYEVVRQMTDRFKESNETVICRELLKGFALDNSATPEARTPEYYGKRPCIRLVADAAKIVEEILIDDIID